MFLLHGLFSYKSEHQTNCRTPTAVEILGLNDLTIRLPFITLKHHCFWLFTSVGANNVCQLSFFQKHLRRTIVLVTCDNPIRYRVQIKRVPMAMGKPWKKTARTTCILYLVHIRTYICYKVYVLVCGDCAHCCCLKIRHLGLRSVPAATDTTRTTTPRESQSPCTTPPSKEGPQRRRRSLATNPWTDTAAIKLNFVLEHNPSCPELYGTTNYKYWTLYGHESMNAHVSTFESRTDEIIFVFFCPTLLLYDVDPTASDILTR